MSEIKANDSNKSRTRKMRRKVKEVISPDLSKMYRIELNDFAHTILYFSDLKKFKKRVEKLKEKYFKLESYE